MSLNYDIKKLKTGDVLLFHNNTYSIWNPISIFSRLIEYFTNSSYSHVGIILKDPTWIDQDLKGIYVWESSYEGTPDPQDNKIKFGVQLTPLSEMMKKRHETLYIRPLYTSTPKLTLEVLKKIHYTVYDKPYDVVPLDWICAYDRSRIHKRTTKRFFCSALVSYIFTEAGIVSKDTDWSIIWPSDFASDNNNLKWENGCYLKKLELFKK